MSRADALAAVAVLLRHVGADVTQPGLAETPRRVVDALAEMTAGERADVAELLRVSFDESKYDGPAVLRGIAFTSLCEHHLLPFVGTAVVAYEPREGRVVGLSKLARVVEAFARRLQLQERLTRQIAEALEEHLQPAGVGVALKASHGCMSCRGVEQPGAEFITAHVLGSFRDRPGARAELITLL